MNHAFFHRYYAQHGEDFVLWEFFDHKKEGVFVDVGAFDGVHLSNSYSFEREGWTGVCVEANPRFSALCRETRKVCENAACVAPGAGDSITLNVDRTGLFSSTREVTEEKNIRGHYELLNEQVGSMQTVSVPARTLDDIIEAYGIADIDFVSIDVEGAELDVLAGFDLDKHQPRVLVMEANTDDERDRLTAYLESAGYRFARMVNVNAFFVRSEKDAECLRSIDVTCVIEKQVHPDGPEMTTPEFLRGKVLVSGVDIMKNPGRTAELDNTVSELRQHVRRSGRVMEEQTSLIERNKQRIASLEDDLTRERSERKDKGRVMQEQADLIGKLKKRSAELDDILEQTRQERKQKVDIIQEQNVKIERLKAERNTLMQNLAEMQQRYGLVQHAHDQLVDSLRAIAHMKIFRRPVKKLRGIIRLMKQHRNGR